MRRKDSYDAAVGELAAYFLHEVQGSSEEDVSELAIEIQQTIEDYISALLESQEEVVTD